MFACNFILWISLIYMYHVHENKINEMFGYSTPIILAMPRLMYYNLWRQLQWIFRYMIPLDNLPDPGLHP